jgi:hypothetical protein
LVAPSLFWFEVAIQKWPAGAPACADIGNLQRYFSAPKRRLKETSATILFRIAML